MSADAKRAKCPRHKCKRCGAREAEALAAARAEDHSDDLADGLVDATEKILKLEAARAEDEGLIGECEKLLTKFLPEVRFCAFEGEEPITSDLLWLGSTSVFMMREFAAQITALLARLARRRG